MLKRQNSRRSVHFTKYHEITLQHIDLEKFLNNLQHFFFVTNAPPGPGRLIVEVSRSHTHTRARARTHTRTRTRTHTYTHTHTHTE